MLYSSGLIIPSRPSSSIVISPTTLNASALQCPAQWQRSSCRTLLIQSTVSINGLHQTAGFKSHRQKKKTACISHTFYITSPMGPSFRDIFFWLRPVVMSARSNHTPRVSNALSTMLKFLFWIFPGFERGFDAAATKHAWLCNHGQYNT